MELVSEVIPESWFARSAPRVAPGLLGALLCVRRQGRVERWKIVEVEAYTQDDPASRSRKGRTPTNEAMFEAAGTIFVAHTGPHRFFHITTGKDDVGEAVLVRAVEPEFPCDAQRLREAAGPARLCKTLGIHRDLNGLELSPENGLWIEFPDEKIARSRVVRTERIGVKKGVQLPRRWYVKTSASVSVREV